MLGIAREFAERGLRSKMVLQIHDELVFECPEDEVESAREVIVRRMQGVYTLKVPLKVNLGVGASWAEAH
jgi:DNA polymerase-1